MVKLFGRGDKDKEEKQFTRDVTATVVGGRAQARTMRMDQQQLNSLGRAYYLQADEDVRDLLMGFFPELIPIFSRLNATSFISSKRLRDKTILYLDIKNILLECEMELDEDDSNYELKRAILQSLDPYAQFRLFDAVDGYRGKLVTEEIDRTTVKVEQPEKKRIF